MLDPAHLCRLCIFAALLGLRDPDRESQHDAPDTCAEDAMLQAGGRRTKKAAEAMPMPMTRGVAMEGEELREI